MLPDIIFSPTDFVAALNQTLEFAYPVVIIEGELANFKVSRNRWVYFDLKDEISSVSFFGSVYQLPGPLSDGLLVRAIGTPRLHPKFGFSINFESVTPVGEGSIKKASDLLYKKLAAEGLFDPQRKRALPFAPEVVALITATNSAAYGDFIKILNSHWGGIRLQVIDSLVQGDLAPLQLATAIEYFNQLADLPDVLVMTRGGGSADDLAAFSDERVVRAVAASRIPTLVAIGHEDDISLAELAADARASTPSNAAQMVVPDRDSELNRLARHHSAINGYFADQKQTAIAELRHTKLRLNHDLLNIISDMKYQLDNYCQLIEAFDPRAVLRRGYAIVRQGSKYVNSVKTAKFGDHLDVLLSDGTIKSKVEGISNAN